MNYKNIASCILGLLMITSCDRVVENRITDSGNSTGHGRIMFVHASPDAPALDLFVDNNALSENVGFLSHSTYMDVSDGYRNLKIRTANAGELKVNVDFSLRNEVSYSLFAANSVNSLEAVIVTDDLETPPAGKCRVRFVHLSPNSPTINVATSAGSSIVTGVPFEAVTPFVVLDAQSYDLRVRDAATNTNTLLSLNGMVMTGGKIYTVILKGLSGVTSGSQRLGTKVITHN